MAKKTTGRFKTREELEKQVRFLYAEDGGALSMEDIATNCEVSAGVVSNILSEVDKEASPGLSVADDVPRVGDVALPAQTNPEFAKYEIAKRVAHTLAASALVPEAYRGRPADCFVAIQMGAEVGMGAFQAIQSIGVIDGKPCLYGDGLIGVCRASSVCSYIREWIDDETKTAWCETLRKGDPSPIKRSFSWDEAEMAGLTTRSNYRKYPKRMLQMRARAFCLRDAYPDVLKGLRVFEEVMDYNDEPAPITSYSLPQKTGTEATKAITEAVTSASITETAVPEGTTATPTLTEVQDAICNATTLAELIKAGDRAAKLKDENEIKIARATYRNKRDELTTQKETA